jgi:radical SAM superfamily enzyme YgiQ (UPF0313 family)
MNRLEGTRVVRAFLLSPASRHVLESSLYARMEPAFPPLSLATLGAVLRRAGHRVALKDQSATVESNEDVLRQILAFEPDLVGISVLTGSWSNVARLVAALRQRRPGLPIVMGNTHASVFADHILRTRMADFVVRGEGEETLAVLADALDGGMDTESIAGLSRLDGETVRHGPDRPPIARLDDLPSPAWDLLDLSAPRYHVNPLAATHRLMLPVMASRGCPYKCDFCSQDKVVRKFRARSIGNVVGEIDNLVRTIGIRQFCLFDSYFPWSRDSGLEFCERMRAMPWHRQVTWMTETRVDGVDDRLMSAMAATGLTTVFYGFESGNEEVLARLGKGTTVAQGREAVRIAHRHGVRTIGFFMLGLPGETPEAMRDTIRFAIQSGVDIAKFGIMVPYPGSRLFDRLGRTSLTPDECDQFTSWLDWSDRPARPFWTIDGLDSDTAIRFQRRAMLEFYARPEFLWRAVRGGTFTMGEMARGGYMVLSRFLRNLGIQGGQGT